MSKLDNSLIKFTVNNFKYFIEPFQSNFSSQNIVTDTEHHAMIKIYEEDPNKMIVYDKETDEM